MRGIILWAAVGVAAIVTGLGLYAAALQTSPAAITNPPAEATPATAVNPSPVPPPSRYDDSAGPPERHDDGDRDDRGREED